MAVPRMPLFRLPGRRAAVALAVGAGVVLTPLPAFAAAGPVASVAAPTAPVVAPTQAAQIAVNTALAQLGKPYVWGAAGPDAFDCSGLTAVRVRGRRASRCRTPRRCSRGWAPRCRARTCSPVTWCSSTRPVSHVGIYIGNGKVVHAPTTGDVVKVSPMTYMPFNSARRLA